MDMRRVLEEWNRTDQNLCINKSTDHRLIIHKTCVEKDCNTGKMLPINVETSMSTCGIQVSTKLHDKLIQGLKPQHCMKP